METPLLLATLYDGDGDSDDVTWACWYCRGGASHGNKAGRPLSNNSKLNSTSAALPVGDDDVDDDCSGEAAAL